jgi:hypothetical protein
VSKPALIPIKGPERATRGGEDEWEPIKILKENLAYVSYSTRCVSLLAQSRPNSYREDIGA